MLSPKKDLSDSGEEGKEQKIELGAPFDPFQYYNFTTDPRYVNPEEGFYVRLKAQGRELIQQYYREKYQTNIQIVSSMEEFLEKKTLDEDKDIQLARKNKEEFRKVFIIGGEAHSYLFAYI